MTDIAFLLAAASGGGAERAMIAVANRFAETGLSVDVVLVRREGPFLPDIGPANLVDLEAGRIRKALKPLNRYVRSARPRLLVSALPGTDLLTLAGKAFLRWPTHLHISVQNSPSASAGIFSDPLQRRWPLLIKTLYRFADSITAISSGVAMDVERLRGTPAGAVPVIHNPVDTAMVAARASQAPPHPWLGDDAGPVILAVGRLVRQKDVPTLLRAFRKLLDRRPDARLIIIGEGPDRAAIESEIDRLGLKQSVALPGFTSNPFAAMAAADLFVLSSKGEGFANVVAEALACGARVVSTDCPSGPAEILEEGRWGRLVPVGDSIALASAMDEALDDQTDKAALRRRAEAFSLDSVFEKYRAYFTARKLIG